MKSVSLLVFAVVLLVSVSLFGRVSAQSAQVSYTVDLSYMSLQLSYPAVVMPGDTVTVNVQVNMKSADVYLQSLTAAVYYVDDSGLHQLTSQTLAGGSASGYGNYGYGYGYAGSSATASFSKSFQLNVPGDAPRTALVAVFAEQVQSTYYNNYYAYPYYSNYYGYYGGYGYPSYSGSYGAASDDALAPLSYIKANTPEYASLQSEYQSLQAQLNQTQAQNQQLQSTVSQQTATINQLNQQLAASNSTAQSYQLLAATLAILAAVLVVITIYRVRSKSSAQTPEPKTVDTPPEHL